MPRLHRTVTAAIIATALMIGCSAGGGGYYVNDGGAGDASDKPVRADGGSTADDANVSVTRKDAGKHDAGTAQEEDSGPIDPPPDDASGPPSTTCAPDSVTSFTPSWKPPNTIHSGACTTTQAEQAVLCMLDSSQDQAACKAFTSDTANAGCLKCVFTPSSASKLGPIIELPGNLVSRNIPGCIAAVSGNTTSSGCGAAVQADSQCAQAACEANCPVPSGDSVALKALNDCETEASQTVCSSFHSAASCGDVLLDGGASVCGDGTDFISSAVNLAQIFCAP